MLHFSLERLIKSSELTGSDSHFVTACFGEDYQHGFPGPDTL